MARYRSVRVFDVHHLTSSDPRITNRVMKRRMTVAGFGALTAIIWLAAPTQVCAQPNKAASARSPSAASQRQFLDRYCVSCHNERLRTGGMSLAPADPAKPGAQPELWEN